MRRIEALGYMVKPRVGRAQRPFSAVWALLFTVWTEGHYDGR
jgi:hypothetical protein